MSINEAEKDGHGINIGIPPQWREQQGDPNLSNAHTVRILFNGKCPFCENGRIRKNFIDRIIISCPTQKLNQLKHKCIQE